MTDLSLGIDLGTATTKLAVLDRHQVPVAPLHPPARQPTVVAAAAEAVVGWSAEHATDPPPLEDFVAAFAASPTGPWRGQAGWTPDALLRTFVTTLLRSPADDRDGRVGIPRQAVIAVPHAWLVATRRPRQSWRTGCSRQTGSTGG